MIKMYCLKCKRETATKDMERVVTKSNRNMLRGKCEVCFKTKNSWVGIASTISLTSYLLKRISRDITLQAPAPN